MATGFFAAAVGQSGAGEPGLIGDDAEFDLDATDQPRYVLVFGGRRVANESFGQTSRNAGLKRLQ